MGRGRISAKTETLRIFVPNSNSFGDQRVAGAYPAPVGGGGDSLWTACCSVTKEPRKHVFGLGVATRAQENTPNPHSRDSNHNLPSCLLVEVIEILKHV